MFSIEKKDTWAVEISNVDKEIDGIINVTYNYTHADGRTEEITDRISDPNSLKKIAFDHIQELNRKDALDEIVKNPPIGAVDFTPVAPSEDVVKQADYEQKRRELIALKQDVELGLKTQEDYDSKLSEIKEILE